MQRLTDINRGQPGVKLFRNALWLLNLVERTLDRSAMLGSKVIQGSAEVNQWSNCSGMPYGYQIWYDDPLTKVKCNAVVEGHKRSDWGQPEVKLRRNAVKPKDG